MIHFEFKVLETNYHIQVKSVATFKSKLNVSMPQNAWELPFKFKKISLKRYIIFKQSFYLLAH